MKLDRQAWRSVGVWAVSAWIGAESANSATPLLGGPTAYEPYAGRATIVRVAKTDASKAQATAIGGAGYEGFEVWFAFEADREIKQKWGQDAAGKDQLLQLVNSWYPGEKYLQKYGIAQGKTFPCVMKAAVSGTASPVIFELQGVNLADYFESQRGSAAGDAGAPSGEMPKEIAPSQTSDDASFGYTKNNPIRVGSRVEFSGPEAQRLYLRHLRDAKFRPFQFERAGSVGAGPDGHILDRYVLTDVDGRQHTLYLDMYHPDVSPLAAQAPKGMYFAK
jgi:hypothetical protein